MFVDILAVIIATLAGFLVGWLWYSPYLFARQWNELVNGGKPENAPPGRFTPAAALGIELALTFVTAYTLAIVSSALRIQGPFGATRLAAWVWLGFIATALFSSVLFERKPLKLFYITAGHRLAVILVMSLIIALWP